MFILATLLTCTGPIDAAGIASFTPAQIGQLVAKWSDPAAPRQGSCPVLESAMPPREGGTPSTGQALRRTGGSVVMGPCSSFLGRPPPRPFLLPPCYVLFCIRTT